MELKPHEEFHLHQTNYAEWCKYIAPRWRDILMKATKDEKQRLWNIAPAQLREAIKDLAREVE